MNSVPNFTLRRDADGYVLHTDDGKDGCFPTLGAALDSLRAQGCAAPATTREQVLSAARACVCGDREQDNWIDLAGYAACGAELELSDAI